MPPKKVKPPMDEMDMDMDDSAPVGKAKKIPTKPKGTRKPSAWNIHLQKVYAKGKKKNPSYKYSQAMKDAKTTYKPPKK